MISKFVCVCVFLEEEELEISPYDDTLMDSRMASLVAGKHSDIQTHLFAYYSTYRLCYCG